jgi:hypothetical protein
MRTSIRATALGLAALTLATTGLAGCSPVVALTPADDAKNTACAEVVVRLPDLVAGLSKRKTDAQGTGAWGQPTAVFLRCGVPVPDPTATLPCGTIDGVDWLVDDRDAPNYVFTTYGRDPAIEIVLNYDDVSSAAALTDLSGAVSVIPADRHCVSVSDLGN